MIVFFLYLQLATINSFINESQGDKWGIYKIKRAEEYVKRNVFYAKKDLMDVLNSNVSDSIKGKACKFLMTLPPDTFENAKTALEYLINLTFYKNRKEDLYFLFYYFKDKKTYDLCEKILRKIASDFPSERKRAQEELFEIFLKEGKIESLYPLIDFIKKERPDLYLFYLAFINDTISFLFNYDTLENLQKFPYYDTLKTIYQSFLGFNFKEKKDPDKRLLGEWKDAFFNLKNKKRADSLNYILRKYYGYILPVYPDSSYFKDILLDILEKGKIEWSDVFKRGLYEFIYEYGGNDNRYFLPSIYFLIQLKKKVKIPDTLRGDSLWIALLLFEKKGKVINYIPKKYSYLKGRFFYLKGNYDSALFYLRESKFVNDLNIAFKILLEKNDTVAIDSLLSKVKWDDILNYKFIREAFLLDLIYKRNYKKSFEFYKTLKSIDFRLLKKYKKFFSDMLIQNKKYIELYRFSHMLHDDDLKILSLVLKNKMDLAEYYFRKIKSKNKFILNKFFIYYAENVDEKGLKFLKKINEDTLLRNTLEKFDSLFVFYKKGIDFLNNKKFTEADSIFTILMKNKLLRKKVIFQKATIKFLRGELQKAKKLFKFLFDNYRDINSLYNLTIILRKLSHDSTLFYYELYEKLTKGRPENYFAKKRLAYLYMDLGNYEKAKEIMKELLGLSPSDFEEKELKFFYMQTLRALLDFEGAMREGFIIYYHYPHDKLFSQTAYQDALEISQIIKFNLPFKN